MSLIDDYVIPYYGLKEGIHEYEFEAKSGFFEFFGNPEIPDGELVINVSLNRRSQFLELRFHIRGSLLVTCDRCLEEFDQTIDTKAELLLRFGDEYEEISDSLVVIPREESRINIAQYIYEYAVLSLPAQNIHPLNEEGESSCNREMLEKLAEYSEGEMNVDEQDNDQKDIDPRWEALKKLKDLN